MREPHAITRARQRYGLDLTLADLDAISAKVANGLSLCLARLPEGASRHAVLCGDRALIVVMSVDGYPITILPRERRRQAKGPPRSKQHIGRPPAWARRYRREAAFA